MKNILLPSVSILILFLTILPLSNAGATEQSKKTALAEELFEVTGMKHNLTVLTQDLLKIEIQKRIQRNPKITNEIANQLYTILNDTFAEKIEEILTPMRRLYAAEFTVDELQAIVTFQKSPAGQKAARLMPILMQKGMALGSKWGREVGLLAFQRIQAKLKKEGLSI